MATCLSSSIWRRQASAFIWLDPAMSHKFDIFQSCPKFKFGLSSSGRLGSCLCCGKAKFLSQPSMRGTAHFNEGLPLKLPSSAARCQQRVVLVLLLVVLFILVVLSGSNISSGTFW